MTKVNLENIGNILVPEQPRTDSTCYGRVDSINDDGSFQVQLNASATKTRCANLCGAGVNDRVLVLIQANGHCAAIGRVGGGGTVTDVLYDNDSGTTGTVTLSKSAANFDHMRIYYKKTTDSAQGSSVDVYQPNGKSASLCLASPFHGSGSIWFSMAVVTISGTSITKTDYATCNIQSGNYTYTSGTNEIYITRVEAWNGTYTSATETT